MVNYSSDQTSDWIINYGSADYERSERSERVSFDGSSSTMAKIILGFFLFAVLVYNSGVASDTQVRLITTNNATTEKTVLAIASNLGWISVVSVVLIMFFLGTAGGDWTENVGKYLIYIIFGMMIIVAMQGVMFLIARSGVDGVLVQLDSTGERNLLIGGILSITIDFIMLMFVMILGFGFFN